MHQTNPGTREAKKADRIIKVEHRKPWEVAKGHPAQRRAGVHADRRNRRTQNRLRRDMEDRCH